MNGNIKSLLIKLCYFLLVAANGIQRENSVNSLIFGRDYLFTATSSVWFLSYAMLMPVIY